MLVLLVTDRMLSKRPFWRILQQENFLIGHRNRVSDFTDMLWKWCVTGNSASFHQNIVARTLLRVSSQRWEKPAFTEHGCYLVPQQTCLTTSTCRQTCDAYRRPVSNCVQSQIWDIHKLRPVLFRAPVSLYQKNTDRCTYISFGYHFMHTIRNCNMFQPS
jgi:hypothetical protein